MSTCSAPRHGTWRAYQRHGCRCPAIVARVQESYRRHDERRRIFVDPLVVEFATKGKPVPMNRVERREAIERLEAARLSARRIAETLHIAERTVTRHRSARRAVAA